MMIDKTTKLSVPKNTGIKGFLRAIETVLKVPFIQKIEINAQGEISYLHQVVEAESPLDPLVFFDDLYPWASIKDKEMEELNLGIYDSSRTLVRLLDVVTAQNLKPLAFIVSTDTVLYKWMDVTSFFEPKTKNLCGIKILEDEHLPDTTLLLAAGLEVANDLFIAEKTYKVEISANGLKDIV